MAPAEQPAKSMRAPAVAPRPCSFTRFVITAATIRLPRNEYPKVASLAAASPDQKSDEQYLTYLQSWSIEGFRLGSGASGGWEREGGRRGSARAVGRAPRGRPVGREDAALSELRLPELAAVGWRPLRGRDLLAVAAHPVLRGREWRGGVRRRNVAWKDAMNLPSGTTVCLAATE